MNTRAYMVLGWSMEAVSAMSKAVTAQQLREALDLVEELKKLEEARGSIVTLDFNITDAVSNNIGYISDGEAWVRIAKVIEEEMHREATRLAERIIAMGIDLDADSVKPPYPVPFKG